MVIHGRIKNGVVVFPEDISLPEGAEVMVVVRNLVEAAGNMTSDERQRRLVEAFQRIISLPIEGSTEPFSGKDHDELLYGKP